MLLKSRGLYEPGFEKDSCGVGFVCNIKGDKSNEILRQGLEVLNRLAHRGATGADPKTGDGAGILIQIPHDFLLKVCLTENIRLPSPGEYGTGMIFLPQNAEERKVCRNIFEKTIVENNLKLLGWRKVPIDNTDIGEYARSTEPFIEQVFIGMGNRPDPLKGRDDLWFERKLYLARRIIENTVCLSRLEEKHFFYITNLSSRTLSYKGLLKPSQLENFFPDLRDPDIKTAVCIVHSRYSTNTFPSWELSQPFRFLAHNGEINTLKGNINSMKTVENLLECRLFGDNLKKIFPVITPGGSDSASLDNVFELLTLSGRSPAHSMMMLIPVAWERDSSMDKQIRDFYKYHACLLEPWDGPAAIAFTDGRYLGAMLDRNGLRPARYIITNKGLIVMASEVGVLDIPPEDILKSARLTPGKMLLIDTAAGEIIGDEEIKQKMASRKPYGTWIDENMTPLEKLPQSRVIKKADPKDALDFLTLLRAFGYSREDLRFILKPMAVNAQEPAGSMGSDTPHAVLSKKNQLFYNYFKQLFAQVTNPAIDPIREEIVMSLESYLGPRANLLDESPAFCRRIRIKTPVLTNADLERIASLKTAGLKAKTIPILFEAGLQGTFLKSLDGMCRDVLDSISGGYYFFILSDRGVGKKYAAIPALIAAGYLHQCLVKEGKRASAGIIIESGEVREVNHYALLLAYGVDCINPYLAYEAVKYLVKEKEISLSPETAVSNYIKAVNKGIQKILSKMGISTLQSYRGAGIYEALGLSQEIIDSCFSGTVSRIEGIGFDTAALEAVERHREAFPLKQDSKIELFNMGGIYQWKKDGERHLWNPDTIASLQDSVRKNDYNRYKEFAGLINDQSNNPVTLRSLLKFKNARPVPIDEVEPLKAIFRRFATGAMSFGSLSKEAHETIARAMNSLGGKSNTGEGGEDPSRFIIMPGGENLRSAIKQVASGRFGVTTNYLCNAEEIQIKIAQGAKPGEGGQLPGHKVSMNIAKTRYTTPGVTLISPPPHHDIYSIEDLAQLIFDLKNTNPRARISVKLVSEIGVGTIAAGVAKGHADMILISGGDGGTGASPLSSIRNAGLPWELGLSETHQTLVLHNLRNRVRLQTDGQLRTGRDVAIAALLGAEEFGFGTAVLIAIGCVMLRHCNLNTCSVGVATQDEVLRNRFRGRSEHIINYFHFVAMELREIMASLGVRTVDEMIGRTELLEINQEMLCGKAKNIDLSRVLYKPEASQENVLYFNKAQDHGIKDVLDRKLIRKAAGALKKSEPVKGEFTIRNSDRTTGAMLSGEICKRYGEQGLPADTVWFRFKGTAGQSFGAWLSKGVTFELEGMANDYVGKGISGGKIIIYPDKKSSYKTEENIIIGNTTFYGAISGEAYISGIAGERFCIRNSGLLAVVEGVGDHACEYMTGGKVVVLGPAGRNFAAGMSGGVAYVFDADGKFKKKCNLDMVELQEIGMEDLNLIGQLIYDHHKYTGSVYAKDILDNLARLKGRFIKVMPLEYKKILEAGQITRELDLSEDYDG